LTLACAAPLTQAADAQPGSAGSLLQVLLGLIAVLALMAGAAWLMKRMGVAGTAGNSVVKVVGAASVGTRERVVVVEVADQWIVVGVAQGSVNALSTMPKQQVAATPPGMPVPNNFAGWLKQTIDRRNGNK
jgi:flagellar protein FliO/FliZ